MVSGFASRRVSESTLVAMMKRALEVGATPDRPQWSITHNRTAEETDLLFALAFDELDKPKAELAALKDRPEADRDAA